MTNSSVVLFISFMSSVGLQITCLFVTGFLAVLLFSSSAFFPYVKHRHCCSPIVLCLLQGFSKVNSFPGTPNDVPDWFSLITDRIYVSETNWPKQSDRANLLKYP